MTQRLKCCVVLFFLFMGISESSLAKEALNLKQLVAQSMHNNRDLRAARYIVSIAHARLVQAGLWPNPSINISNYDDRYLTNEGDYTRSIGFTQAFPISGRISSQKNVARADVLKAIAEIKEAERQLSAKVATTYYTLLMINRRFQQVNYLLSVNKEFARVAHQRYHAAEVSELDNNSARIEYQRILQEKRLLQSALVSQQAQLNRLVGLSPNQKLPVLLQLPPHKTLPKALLLNQLALKNRPDREALIALIQRGHADVLLAKKERFADWTFNAGVQQNRIFVEGGEKQPPDNTLGINLTVPVPLLNQNQGRIAEAGATTNQAYMLLNALNLAIETEVANNYAQLNALHATLHDTQDHLLTIGIKNVNLAKQAYRNGQISMLDWLLVQRQQNDLQTTYLANLEKYLQAYVALCTAIGPGVPSSFCPYLAYCKESPRG